MMWHYSNEEERHKWQDPEAILTEIGLKAGMTFLDIGCGDGFFALPAAEMVGQNGKIFAGFNGWNKRLDRGPGEGSNNITLHTARAEEDSCQNCADMVFARLHDFDDAQRYCNAHWMLKPQEAGQPGLEKDSHGMDFLGKI
jgi:predicted methyltransferase